MVDDVDVVEEVGVVDIVEEVGVVDVVGLANVCVSVQSEYASTLPARTCTVNSSPKSLTIPVIWKNSSPFRPEFGGCFAFCLVRGGLGMACFHYMAGVSGAGWGQTPQERKCQAAARSRTVRCAQAVCSS